MIFEPGKIYENGVYKRRVLRIEDGQVFFIPPRSNRYHDPEQVSLADFQAWYDEGGHDGPLPLDPQELSRLRAGQQ